LVQQERARQLQQIVENTKNELAERTLQLDRETAARETKEAELASTQQQLAERNLQLTSAELASTQPQLIAVRTP
jgi:hypothetical protein